MKPLFKALRTGCSLAALLPFAIAAYAADTAKPAGTAAPTPEPALHEIGAAAADVTPTPAPAKDQRTFHGDFDDDKNNRVSVSGTTYVGPDETIEGNAVAVMGP